MVEVKGLDPAVADKIGILVQKKGQFELIEELEKSDLGSNKSAAVSIVSLLNTNPYKCH